MRRRRGFSLVEVLVGILILTIVVTTSLVVFSERKKRLLQAQETIAVYQALANEAELQRRVRFESLITDRPTAFLSDAKILAPLQPYAAIVTVAETNSDVRTVTMTVRWSEGKRNARLTIVRANTGGTNLW